MGNGKHILKDLTENRERYLGEQETELEDMNEIGMDKINLDIEIVKVTVKSLKHVIWSWRSACRITKIRH